MGLVSLEGLVIDVPTHRRRVEHMVFALLAVVVGSYFVQGRFDPVLDAPFREAPSAEVRTGSALPSTPIPPESAAAGRILAVPGAAGTLEAVDPSYRAEFDPTGFRFAPSGATEPLSIALTDLARGGAPIAVDRTAWSGRDAVVERTVASGVTERVTVGKGSVEWDVVLAAAPAGVGDLSITGVLGGVVERPEPITVEGRPAARLAVAGGAHVTIDEVVVKDAGGAVLHRALPEFTDGEIVLRVPAAVLDDAAYPLTVDPTVSAPVTVAPAGNRYLSSSAWSGALYAVVWQEFVAGQYDIYSSLVASDLSVVSAPQRVSFRAENETLPDLAWNGRSFLVVWEHQFGPTDTDIRGQRLTGLGTLEGAEVEVSVPTSVQRQPAVSAGAPNSDFLVTWHDARGGDTEAYAARVSPIGGTYEPFGIPLSANTDADVLTDVAWNGSKWLVVWENFFDVPGGGYSIRALSVFPNGVTGAGNAITLWAQAARDPAIASDGAGWLVAWEQPGASGSDVRAARVPNNEFWYTGESLAVGVATDDQSDPAVAYNGDYFVAWRERRFPPDPDIYGNRIGSDGTVRDGAAGFGIVASTAFEDNPSVARGPAGKWITTYESGPDGATSIQARVASK